MRRFSIVVCLLLSSCTHNLGSPLELETEKGNLDAHKFLQAANFDAAREKYGAVLEADPTNVEAAFGWAIADLMTLPKWKPITDVLDRCHQPTFDVAREVFGPSGVLARGAVASAGTAAIDVHFFPSSGSGGARLDFEPTSVKSEIYTHLRSNSQVKTLDLHIYDARTSQGAWLSIYFNPDDMTKNDGTNVVPFADGVEVELIALDGDIYVSDPSRLQNAGAWYASSAPLQGSIKVWSAGRNPGDPIQVELKNVTLPANCSDPSCTSTYGITGMVDDTLTERVDFDPASIPFGTVRSDQGPPRRSDLVVALEFCSPIDTDFLALKARELGDLLAANGQRLAIVAAADPSFTFEIPKELLHARRDLVLNVTDARMLWGFVETAAAFIELAGQWRYADGTLQDLVKTFKVWEDPIGMFEPEEVDVRDFEPSILADNLARTMLVRAPDMELGVVKLRLDRALSALTSAIDDTSPAAVGVFDFQVPATGRLFQEISSGLSALRSSLDAPQPVMWPEAALFRFHLRQLFDAPLDRDRILSLTGLNALVRLQMGDLQAPNASDRNHRVVWESENFASQVDRLFNARGEDPVVIESWLGGIVDLPADRTMQTCTTSSECGVGYGCVTDRCVADLPWAFTVGAWTQVERDGWPVFVNPGLRDAFGL